MSRSQLFTALDDVLGKVGNERNLKITAFTGLTAFEPGPAISTPSGRPPTFPCPGKSLAWKLRLAGCTRAQRLQLFPIFTHVRSCITGHKLYQS